MNNLKLQEVPKLIKYYDHILKPQFEKENISDLEKLRSSSDTQKEVSRLIKVAFKDEKFTIELEK